MTRKTARGARLAALEHKRHQRIADWIASGKKDLGARLAETRRLFGVPVVTVDPHTHSNHSDGLGTVAMNRAVADLAGVDFIFATDHHSLRQKLAARRLAGVSWGQEPGARFHHIGLLGNRRLLKPRGDDFAEDFVRARRLAPFTWVPHPAGWYPKTEYSGEQIAALWTLGPVFALEVINGAHKIFTAFDRFDRAAVTAWDRLLCDGRRVTALGASDAHAPESVGCAWTAVFDCPATAGGIIGALNAGRCLASEAPLLDLALAGRRMGSVVEAKAGRRLRLDWRAADAAGLQSVRVVSDGRVLEVVYPRGETVASGSLALTVAGRAWFRLEAEAVDGRRAFSTPVYLETAGKQGN